MIYFYIYFNYKMKKVDKPTRKCKDCDVIIAIIPRRPRCVDCYKKKLKITNDKINPIDLFVPDDD